MKHFQQGFTLVELMIVVAIIGILAAIALPAYSDYLTRSQVTEAVTLLGGLKTPVTEYATDKNIWPTGIMPPPGVGLGATQVVGTTIGKYTRVTDSVAGTFPDGVLTATMTAGKASGKKLSLTTADGGASWACGMTTVDVSTGAAADNDMDAKYLPNACKP